MYPELFSIGPITVYSYGVLLAASYLLGLRLAMSRAKKWGLDAEPRPRPRHLHHHRRARRREAAAAGRRLRPVPPIARRTCCRWLRSGGVFYGGLILAVAVAFWYIARHRMPFWTTCDVFAPGIALGHVTGRLGCLAAGCCYGKPTDVPWAIDLHQPAGRRQRRHAARHPAASDAALRGGRGAADPVLLLATERRGRPFAGRTFWVYMLLYAVSRYIIEIYRGDPRGVVLRRLLDVAVHLAGPGAAQPGHAGLAVARARRRRRRKPVTADAPRPEAPVAGTTRSAPLDFVVPAELRRPAARPLPRLGARRTTRARRFRS